MDARMPVSAKASLQDQLAGLQNQDGGWGYQAGKSSWLEPTFYAMLALEGVPGHAVALDRAFALIRSWQLPNGGCQPNSKVDQPNWTTALWVSLHCRRRVLDDRLQKAVEWLVQSRGAESSPLRWLANRIRPMEKGYRPELYGWNWFPETHSWVEPTAHAIVALQLALSCYGSMKDSTRRQARDRVALGRQMLLARRCADGGWNYGSPRALGIELASYPETTATALLGLQNHPDPAIQQSLDNAQSALKEERAPQGRVRIELALRVHGRKLEASSVETAAAGTMLLALQALVSGGNFRLLKTTAVGEDS